MIRNLITIPALIIASLLATSFTALAQENSLTPYTSASEVPQTALDLWKDYDPRKEDLEVRTHMEWKQDGVVTRLISFKVGTFKGSDSRIAAYYCFPDNGEKNPAFVWSHGGAQRAHRNRGFAFATQGFATVDINWLGRDLLLELDVNGTYNAPDKEIGKFHYERKVRGNGPQTILLEVKDFEKVQNKNKNDKALEWSKISTFTITLTDDKTKEKIKLASPEEAGILKRIELVKP